MTRVFTPQADLHNHLGAAVDPAVLWSIAHRQGIKLPSKDYWTFYDFITMGENRKNRTLDEMHGQFFYWTELIQSSPDAIESAVHGVIGGAYRKCNIVLNEVRFNPMFRNRDGERDLDHIIQSAIWGMERAVLEYPQVSAGLILMMDRTLTIQENEIILKKAIKYGGQGVVGVDIAGPERGSFRIEDYVGLLREAKDSGLGVTIHSGETGALEELIFVVKQIKPNRIGHGIKCVQDKCLMDEISEQGILLETCPTSNLKNSVVSSLDELRHIYRMLIKHSVKFCINTDGPELYRTHLLAEHRLLQENNILDLAEIEQTTQWAFEGAFVGLQPSLL